MSRGKKKAKPRAKGGSAKTTPRRTPANRHSAPTRPVHDERTFAHLPPRRRLLTVFAAIAPKFSLQDEARWMSNHRTTAFQPGNKLRHMPVHFVSAGHLQGTLKEPLPDDKLVQANCPENASDSVTPSSPASTPDNAQAMAHMAIRSPSPAPSDASSSSADEVLFRGRGGQPSAASAPTTIRPNQSATNPPTQPTEIHKVQGSAKSSLRADNESHAQRDAESDVDEVDQDQFAKRRRGRPAWEGTTTEWVHRSKPGIGWQPSPSERTHVHMYPHNPANPRDAALDDYMQNIEDFGFTNDLLTASAFARREMDLDAGSHNDWDPNSPNQDGRHNDHDSEEWGSDLLQAFDDLSTSSDVAETVVRILSKRTRKSGLHYLCVYEGSVIDDARWLPATFLKSPDEKRVVQAFEAKITEREQQMFTSSDSTSEYDELDGEDEEEEGEDDDDDDDDEDEEEDEEEDVDEYADELDDETIARILQKQEELGLGSDEMVLYGGDSFFDSSGRTKVSTFGSYKTSNKKRQSRTRGHREASFPSASAMVDALEMDPYGGFDIMDTERPSLKPKKKGRRGQPPPELEDSDLNEQLQNAWAADRAKKRLKKAEREELRQQGLLGRRGKAPNLKVKYQGGIDMEDVVEELREFLLGDMHSLALPPMESSRRATIHQVAAFFNLSSRSRGDGMDRFTVLSKTSRTHTYTDDEFDIAIQKRNFHKRLRGPLYSQGGGGRSGRFSTIKHKQGGVRSKPQVGYKDGETVGANAPELGPENKGHALMMKMGWSKGTALGAGDNKGILVPVAHTVKINKAGLQ
ncbi:hypothetical protein yc1106_00579 [Curvularia clavata]|uniref:Protein SQS1 n=1 Tax=Curvularia clavata TaxID=95742 RepID=A0A9Q8Z0J0_CURCL|nr:hypothetical protein yc1106_00579 [Curvularia clavata]